MKRLVREPLVHFLLIGVALFTLYASLNRESSGPDEIFVSAGQIESLASNFAQVRHRPPTDEELKEQIDEYVKEELFSREAVNLGLDHDDPVIRERLQRKMDFFVEDSSALTQPTDEKLSAYLAANAREYREDARFTFKQVYLNPNSRGASLDADAEALLVTLREQGTPVDLNGMGDELPLPRDFERETGSAVVAQFGTQFADALEGLPSKLWSGPVPSRFGQHLVCVIDRMEARMPGLDEVRRQVERSWRIARREEASQLLLNDLLKQYTVIVEWPEHRSETLSEEQSSDLRP